MCIRDSLNRVHAEIDISQQWQGFNVLQLPYLGDVVQTQLEELKRLDGLEALQRADAILTQVKRSEHWHRLESLNSGQLVRSQEELFDPEILQVLNLANLVADKRQHPQTLVSLKTINFGD